MEMLRDKNKHLERRLAELVRYGHENDSSRWTARVIAERDPYALPRTIADGIAEVFDVPQTALRVGCRRHLLASRLRAGRRGSAPVHERAVDAVLRGEHGLRGRAVARARGRRPGRECGGWKPRLPPATARPHRSRCSRCVRRSPATMRPRSACSCSARPTRAASTTGWPPISPQIATLASAAHAPAAAALILPHAMTDDPITCRT